MSADLSARLRVASLVLLALIGTWLGHAIEYGVIAGWRGVELGLLGPIHSYMAPAALVLVVAAFGLSQRVAALARLAQRRCEYLWRQLRRGIRDDVASSAAATPRQWTDKHGVALLLLVGAAQVVLYLLQENVEAALAGVSIPGIGAITAAHWTAPLVQFGVASCLTLGWLVASRILHRRLVAVDHIEAVLAVIARCRQRAPAPRTPKALAAPCQGPSRRWAPRAPPVPSAA